MEAWIDQYAGQTVSVAGLIVALGVFYGVLGRVRRRIGTSRSRISELAIGHLSAPVQALFVVIAVYLATRQFDAEFLHSIAARKGFAVTTMALATWLAIQSVGLASAIVLRRFNLEARDNLNARMMHTQVRVIRRLVSAIILLLGIAAALMVFDQIRALGVSLLASAGVAGVVLGFAAQKTIGNFFTGLQIAITQPIRIDDAVVVEGEWGWIEEINLTYVVVKIWDQRRLILPISYFVEKPFQNWTRTTADILGTVVLYLDYTVPLEAVRDELDGILAQTDLWDGKVKSVQVTETTERTMVVRILVSASDSPSAWDLRCLVRERMIAFIRDNHPGSLPRLRSDLPLYGRDFS